MEFVDFGVCENLNDNSEDVCTIVKDVWKKILNVKKISVEDSFFDLNGNSLQAIIMMENLKKELKIELLIQDIYEHETLQEFVDYIEMKKECCSILVKGRVEGEIPKYDKRVSNRLVLKSMEQYDKNILNKSKNSYKMMKFQKYFIRMGHTNYLSILSNVINVKNCKEEVLIDALKKLILEQAVLRTGISEDEKYMCEYDCNEWNIPVIDKDKYSGNWDELVKQLTYIRNEHESFGKKHLLSKIFVLKITDNEYEVRIFIHHCLWDRMSHIIVANHLKKILNEIDDDGMNIEPYHEYVRKNRVTANNIIKFNLLLAKRYLIPVLKYKRKINGKRCFDVTVCWQPDKKFLEEFKKNPVENNLKMFNDVISRLGIDVKENPFIVLANGRRKENSKTLGMYINTVMCLYKNKDEYIENIMSKDGDFGRSVSNKLFFEMGNTALFEMFSKTIPIVNYVGLFPGYVKADETFGEIIEIDTKKPYENRITSFVSDNRIHISFKVFANNAEEVEEVFNKIINQKGDEMKWKKFGMPMA